MNAEDAGWDIFTGWTYSDTALMFVHYLLLLYSGLTGMKATHQGLVVDIVAMCHKLSVCRGWVWRLRCVSTWRP